jgi:osmoprotectant transport system ATP-binding protein
VFLELRQLSKCFAGQTVLDSFDLSLAEGQCAVLIGPSGCGKSTVLRLINGVIKADSGEIILGQQKVDSKNLRSLRHRMGYVIQEGGLFPHLRATDNVSLLARHLKWSAARITSRVHELAELTKLEPSLLARYPEQLSGGQRQRVSLMRALMLDPELLLLDEPLGSLDPLIRFDLQRDLKAIFQDLGKTVLLVTHDLAEASFFADDIVLMRAGKILQRGPLRDFQLAPADPFVTRFVEAQRTVEVCRPETGELN